MKSKLVILVLVLGLVTILYFAINHWSENQDSKPGTSVPVSQESLNIAQKSMDLLSKQDFETLQTCFDDHMKKEASPEQARKIWNSYTQMVGPFQKVIGIKSEKNGNMDKIILTCQFEKKTVDFRVLVNQNNQIALLEPEDTPKVVTTN